MTPRFNRLPAPTLVFAAALLVAGCTSDNSDYHRQIQENAQQSAKQPTMAGGSRFFEGKIDVEVKLGRGFRPRVNKAIFESRDDPFRQDPNDKEEKRYQSLADDDEYFIPRMHNSVLPPHALRLRVTNESQETVEVDYLECNSSLGNFVVRPAKATLEAGKSHEPEAMISLLGASGEDIPIKLTFAFNGRRETQIVTLKLATAAAKAAPLGQ
ncbi:hypothetical protein [Nibricoccus sp. IMCC34717]|uniref:hypothetical protein n=1 Tax=Nibricoccus sp. IMCC34717 TaxID=3034021 RepID=UPI00384FEB63